MISQKLFKIAQILKKARFNFNFQSITSDLAAPRFRGLSSFGFTHVDYTMEGMGRWRRLYPDFQKFFKQVEDYLRIQPKGMTVKKIAHKSLEDQKVAEIYEVEKQGTTAQFALVSGDDVYAIYTNNPRTMLNLL